MAVTIRLARQGAKKQAQYLVVAIDSQKKRDGEYLEKLGHYFPQAKTEKEKIKLNLSSVDSWLKKGAQMSKTARELIKIAKTA